MRIILSFLPETRCFKFKAAIYRWAGAAIDGSARICSSATCLGHGSLRIGYDTWVGHDALIVTTDLVDIGSYVDIGPRVYIGTGTHQLGIDGKRAAGDGVSLPVVVEDGVWICQGASILPGVTIGAGAVVAAGAVVNKDVAPRTMVGGVPAVHLKDL